jgi:hypothetical protein
MAATRVRLLPEHRNGNGNYLRAKHGGQWIPSNGENDLAALEAAYMVMLQEIGITAKQLADFRNKHKPASHD